MQVPKNDFQRDILENLDVFYQMLGNCGQDEPLYSPKHLFLAV